MNEEKTNIGAVEITTGNFTEIKMKAILNLSEAVKELSKALSSACTKVEISHCNISATDKEPAIEVKPE